MRRRRCKIAVRRPMSARTYRLGVVVLVVPATQPPWGEGEFGKLVCRCPSLGFGDGCHGVELGALGRLLGRRRRRRRRRAAAASPPPRGRLLLPEALLLVHEHPHHLALVVGALALLLEQVGLSEELDGGWGDDGRAAAAVAGNTARVVLKIQKKVLVREIGRSALLGHVVVEVGPSWPRGERAAGIGSVGRERGWRNVHGPAEGGVGVEGRS